MRSLPFLPALLLLPLLAGCGAATTSDWRRCTFDVTDVAFLGLRNDQAEWRVSVAAVNPNPKRLKLEGLYLWAVMEGDTLAMLNNPGRIELGPLDTTRLSLDVSVPHAAWNRALARMRRTGSGEILITGDVEAPTLFGTRTIRNAVREKHTIDLASILGGGDFLRNLLFR